MNDLPPGEPANPGRELSCQRCNARIVYDAGAQAMKCPYCGLQQNFPRGPAGSPGGREIPLEEGIRLAARGFGTPVTQVRCGDCGAVVNVVPGEQTAQCAFCGSHQVLSQEAPGTAIRPESMVPFKVDKAAANQKFKHWLGRLWFRPNDLKELARLQGMAGVYIPFWTFDAWARSNWTAKAGYYYNEIERYTDAGGQEQTRQVQRTRWEPVSGSRQDFFDDLLVCASRGLPAELAARFQTFDTRQLTPYRPEFLAGWRAESYAIDLMPAWDMAQKKMSQAQWVRCTGDVPGDTHSDLRVDNVFSHATFKHVLLPIWIAAYRYKEKPYRFLVNGQTGEVVGKAPWSLWKILLAALAAAIVIAVIAVLYTR